MSTYKHIQRAFADLQHRFASLYYERVTVPVGLWIAAGRPKHRIPSIPWWQPFVARYLILTGYPVRRYRQQRRRRL